MNPPTQTGEAQGHVLIADDEPLLLNSLRRILESSGHTVDTASDGHAALDLINREQFDAIISDISMPGVDGIQLLRAIRERDSDVPVILITGNPAVETAVQGVEYGIVAYMVKPFDLREFRRVIAKAVKLRRLAKLSRDAVAFLQASERRTGDRAEIEAVFRRAMRSLWVAFHPIINWGERRIHGYEALVRTSEPRFNDPATLFSIANRVGKLHDLGRRIRELAALSALAGPEDAIIYINLHPQDLRDDSIYLTDAPLSNLAPRVVLEITERASLSGIEELPTRIRTLRQMGFRIAIDDFGAGYSGLGTFAQLEPEVVKLDISLVAEVHKSPTKQKLIRSMTDLCHELGIQVIAEGIETSEERDTVLGLGCDLLQGFLFARPALGFAQCVL
jgi:EAL domain-containing protein (putative c-di-GMP-specific phosphodiesterase class I)/ActR/RegA family two-component response regulator